MDALISPGMVAFEDFRFDVDLRRLLRLDAMGVWAPSAVGSRALDILAVLLRKPGTLVTKDAIIDQVWPGTSVETNNLTVQITALRKVLDSGRRSESCIQTVSGRGYRFVAPVTRLPAEGVSETLPQDVRDAELSIGSDMPAQRRSLGTREKQERLVDGLAPTDPSLNSGTFIVVTPAEPAERRRAERRQLTVMACDVTDLAMLSAHLDLEDLAEVTAACSRCCTDIVERYNGHVGDHSTDGVLAYFGYPQADEHGAERAIRAGLALVEALPKLTTAVGVPLHVSVGIATGIVVATCTTETVTMVGNTPKLAVRLRGLATADQIVIAASTRRLAGNAFELSHLGKHDLEGIAQPIHAWRVERALVTESRFEARGNQALTPLVGRQEELDLLLRRWSQAKDGEGQVVVLSGEPGIGKSRVLSALRERLEAQGVQAHALRFQCSPYNVNSAFWPVIDNFERMLKFTRDETTDAKLDKLEELVFTQYGRPLADVRFVASILSIPCETRYGPLSMTPQKHKDETLRALVDLTEAAARKHPSVMLFEDAHWADPTTLEVLDLLIDRVKTVPLLIVLTHRPEFQSRWSGQGHVGALNLSKLTRAESAAMVSSLAGGKALPAALLEQILAKTDGVPLFVEELTKSIFESGGLIAADDRCKYGGSAPAVAVPATLRDLLMARLDRSIPVKEVAQIGAAIGREFSYELIAAVAPTPAAQLDDSLVRLSESGLAFRRGTPPDAVYTFKHALVQEAAYDSLLKSRRQELHGKIARVIEQRFPNLTTTEPEVLAHHFTAAGLTEAAIPLWQAAGELALKRWALTEAIAHLNEGLKLVVTLPQSSQRDARELGLRRLLGPICAAFSGWAASRASTNPQMGSVLTKFCLPLVWGLTIRRSAPGIYWRPATGDRPRLVRRETSPRVDK
jgi:class 3 adenylate cyclase/DNA-binding winged helix-turn-helix (wHTH) protein